MSHLLLYNNSDKFLKIPKNKCVKIELEINKSKYSKEWIKLGDKLYYFVYPRYNVKTDSENNFSINDEQYNFIQGILNTL